MGSEMCIRDRCWVCLDRCWRPFVGWTCGVALAWHFVGQPLAVFVITYAGVEAPPLPVFEMQSLLTVLLGMLGLGGLRTFEKTKGVSREK